MEVLEAGAKISVLHVDITHDLESPVLSVTRELVLKIERGDGGVLLHYDAGGVQRVRFADEGTWWCRGWDEESIAAMVAMWRLTESAR